MQRQTEYDKKWNCRIISAQALISINKNIFNQHWKSLISKLFNIENIKHGKIINMEKISNIKKYSTT